MFKFFLELPVLFLVFKNWRYHYENTYHINTNVLTIINLCYNKFFIRIKISKYKRDLYKQNSLYKVFYTVKNLYFCNTIICGKL